VTTWQAPDEGGPARPRSQVNVAGVALISASHVIDDFYQGVVPALLPFLVAERHYSYAAVSGITLAATVLSSVAQPAFGVWADRRSRRWMVPCGMLLAAVGVALAGLMPNYPLTWIVVAASGLGIAAFHPEAARGARQAAGRSNTAMSIFALGGNAGYALGSLVATPVLLAVGLHGTALLVLPAVVMALILSRTLGRTLDGRTGRRPVPEMPSGRDDWRSFATLTVVVVIRSILFFGVTSFIALYFIHQLDASEAVGGAALTVFLVTGAVGTLLGGWLGDRFSPLVSIRTGFLLAIPALAGVVLAGSVPWALVAVAVAGISSYLPFSVFVLLGQDYLPNRIGTASGVTVGLAVSIGGLANPLLGALADATSLRLALTVLIALPVLALVVASFLHLPEPASSADDDRGGGPAGREDVGAPGGGVSGDVGGAAAGGAGGGSAGGAGRGAAGGAGGGEAGGPGGAVARGAGAGSDRRVAGEGMPDSAQ
jgi:FSR family fosmidomycin resistance protein-like MFS transporter